jgi:FMN phosphatase YigB (HAD superfamily)
MVHAKTLIIDLNDTLIYFSRISALWHLPHKWEFLLYCCETKQTPLTACSVLHALTYNILEIYGYNTEEECPYSNYSKKIKLPLLMVQLIQGNYSEKDCLEKALECVEIFEKNKGFTSKNEKVCIQAFIKMAFESSILIQTCRVYKDLEQVLIAISQEIDSKTGNKKHRIIILSNMHAEAFEKMKYQNELKNLFTIIPEEHWIISGLIHLIKPQKDIFNYVFTIFNIQPNDCIFVDDQEENINLAKSLGMTTIWCDKNRPKMIEQLRSALQ